MTVSEHYDGAGPDNTRVFPYSTPNCRKGNTRTTSERYEVKCKLFGWWRCTRYRLIYATVYRTSYTQHTEYDCCPGWTNMVSNVCGTPICGRQCLNGGTCVAPDTCECPPGYSGTTCSTDVNECNHDNGGCEQTCANTDGSYYCTCGAGFTLTLDGHHCHDGINECLLANGGCQQNCHNTVGSFYCSCYDGYNLKGDGTSCEDINECEIDNGGCEHECENYGGGSECFCRTGYQLAVDNSSCEDTNECWKNMDGCNHSCHNTLGSYYCTCDDGFLLQSDGQTCQDVNECNHDNGGCEQTCANTDGSYYCTCGAGFTLTLDGHHCHEMTTTVETSTTAEMTTTEVTTAEPTTTEDPTTTDIATEPETTIQVDTTTQMGTTSEEPTTLPETTTEELATTEDTDSTVVDEPVPTTLIQGAATVVTSDKTPITVSLISEKSSPLSGWLYAVMALSIVIVLAVIIGVMIYWLWKRRISTPTEKTKEDDMPGASVPNDENAEYLYPSNTNLFEQRGQTDASYDGTNENVYEEIE
ncbi:multiple epidermal growth factor-like domains protein 6 isoform X1 [Ptychodera flava]|uniref:multiple epidermal growth factor-like domains protein 6 isoform X1 n=2 Tax=Ptychodera flava TaxID=63121 RepID=UPI00396AAB83